MNEFRDKPENILAAKLSAIIHFFEKFSILVFFQFQDGNGEFFEGGRFLFSEISVNNSVKNILRI